MARDKYDIGWIFLVQLPLFGLMIFLAPGEDTDNDGKKELELWYLGVIFAVIIITNIIWFRVVKPRIRRDRY